MRSADERTYGLRLNFFNFFWGGKRRCVTVSVYMHPYLFLNKIYEIYMVMWVCEASEINLKDLQWKSWSDDGQTESISTYRLCQSVGWAE